MIDMALLKKAMAQMDAEDPDEAQAAKERAAQTLSDAKLSFAKLAELIEQRRLLLRPRIVTGLKRMDQPGMLGDAAFRDAGSALRREGQSFFQIAEAIELSGGAPPGREDLAQRSEPLHEMPSEASYQTADEPLYQLANERGRPAWLRALVFVGSIVFFPLRHPFRFLTLALVAIVLYYALRDIAGLNVDQLMSSVTTFVNEQILRRPKETKALPTTPTPSPSATAPSPTPMASPSTGPASPKATPTPSASASPPPPAATPVPPSAGAAAPPVSTPPRHARGAPAARSAANCCVAPEDRYPNDRCCAPYEDDRPHMFDEIIPQAFRRNSRVAGPCVAGVGGCAWGGGRY
jgi:hypothetical protein